MDGLDHGIGARALQTAQLVQPHDDHAAQRQQVQHPRVPRAHLRGIAHAQVERRAHKAAHAAYQRAHRQPFQHCGHIQAVVCDALLYLLHGGTALSFTFSLQSIIVSSAPRSVKPRPTFFGAG